MARPTLVELNGNNLYKMIGYTIVLLKLPAHKFLSINRDIQRGDKLSLQRQAFTSETSFQVSLTPLRDKILGTKILHRM